MSARIHSDMPLGVSLVAAVDMITPIDDDDTNEDAKACIDNAFLMLLDPVPAKIDGYQYHKWRHGIGDVSELAH